MISISTYQKVAIALHELSNVPVRLCTSHLVPVYATPDAKQTVPGFHQLPNTQETCCRVRDSSGVYQAVGIWNSSGLLGYLIVGPSKDASDDLSYLMINLVRQPPLDVRIQEQQIYIPEIHEEITSDELGDASQILSTYVAQNQLMDAISTGNHAFLTEVTSTMTSMKPFLNRIPNRELRSAKNIMFVFNTLCRIAAERGSASKILIDQLSSKYALAIEKISSLQQATHLISQMPFKYCDLVRIKRSKRYNTCVSAAIEYVMLHYKDDLHLKIIAQAVHTSPSYLSRRFHQDTGVTLFSFINHYRIKIAESQLRDGNHTISEVAIESGFNSIPYFNRVFKQITGTTPQKYISNF